jgi:hypothetical protein
MQFSVSLKTPDALDDGIQEFLDGQEPTEQELEDYGDREGWEDAKREALTKFASKWFRWGESVELEFDTEKGTAEVKVVKQR